MQFSLKYSLDFLLKDDKYAINCNTREKAKVLFENLHKRGFKWADVTPYEIDDHDSYAYEDKTCYVPAEGTHCDIDGLETENNYYTIISFDDIEFDYFSFSKNTTNANTNKIVRKLGILKSIEEITGSKLLTKFVYHLDEHDDREFTFFKEDKLIGKELWLDDYSNLLPEEFFKNIENKFDFSSLNVNDMVKIEIKRENERNIYCGFFKKCEKVSFYFNSDVNDDFPIQVELKYIEDIKVVDKSCTCV